MSDKFVVRKENGKWFVAWNQPDACELEALSRGWRAPE